MSPLHPRNAYGEHRPSRWSAYPCGAYCVRAARLPLHLSRPAVLMRGGDSRAGSYSVNAICQRGSTRRSKHNMHNEGARIDAIRSSPYPARSSLGIRGPFGGHMPAARVGMNVRRLPTRRASLAALVPVANTMHRGALWPRRAMTGNPCRRGGRTCRASLRAYPQVASWRLRVAIQPDRIGAS